MTGQENKEVKEVKETTKTEKHSFKKVFSEVVEDIVSMVSKR